MATVQREAKLYRGRVRQSRTLAERIGRVGPIGESCAPAKQSSCTPCCMSIINHVSWHAGHATRIRTYPFGFCAAEQAAARPGSGRRPTLRAVHTCTRGMACCMSINHVMKNDACMPGMHHGNCQRPPASLFRESPKSVLSF